MRSAEQMLADYAPLNKVDRPVAAASILVVWKSSRYLMPKILGRIQRRWLDGQNAAGRVSRDGLDVGSQLLLSTLTPHTKVKCWMSAAAQAFFPLLLRAFTEDPPHSVRCLCTSGRSQRATLAANSVEGEVFASNVFSR